MYGKIFKEVPNKGCRTVLNMDVDVGSNGDENDDGSGNGFQIWRES